MQHACIDAPAVRVPLLHMPALYVGRCMVLIISRAEFEYVPLDTLVTAARSSRCATASRCDWYQAHPCKVPCGASQRENLSCVPKQMLCDAPGNQQACIDLRNCAQGTRNVRVWQGRQRFEDLARKRDQIENTERRSKLICKGICDITDSCAACLRSAAAAVSTLHVHRSCSFQDSVPPNVSRPD